MRQLLRGTVIFLMATAWPAHAQDNLPYTTYSSFDQLLKGRNARYVTITRVSHPGDAARRAYTGFFFYQIRNRQGITSDQQSWSIASVR